MTLVKGLSMNGYEIGLYCFAMVMAVSVIKWVLDYWLKALAIKHQIEIDKDGKVVRL